MMECMCACAALDSPEFYREQTPVARKVHRCCECGESIIPGEQYHRGTGMYEGYWYRYETCLICSRIRADLCREGWVFGELRAQIRECMGFDYVTGLVVPGAAERARKAGE